MIKFFRKIRQQMLKENKTSKYLLYAIGEIILVVIGILIALQINKWNESKINQQTEIEFIIGLKKDLNQDKLKLESCIKNVENNIEAQHFLTSELPTNYKINKKKLDSVFLVFLTPLKSFFPVSGTFDASVSSGNMALFKNKELISKTHLLYNSKYPRLVYNGEIMDDLALQLINRYAHEQRIGEIGHIDTFQLSELLDNVSRGRANYIFRKKIFVETLELVDEILANY
jgi:hypothetical protein